MKKATFPLKKNKIKFVNHVLRQKPQLQTSVTYTKRWHRPSIMKSKEKLDLYVFSHHKKWSL